MFGAFLVLALASSEKEPFLTCKDTPKKIETEDTDNINFDEYSLFNSIIIKSPNDLKINPLNIKSSDSCIKSISFEAKQEIMISTMAFQFIPTIELLSFSAEDDIVFQTLSFTQTNIQNLLVSTESSVLFKQQSLLKTNISSLTILAKKTAQFEEASLMFSTINTLEFYSEKAIFMTTSFQNAIITKIELQASKEIYFHPSSFYESTINRLACASNKFKFSRQSFQGSKIHELLLKSNTLCPQCQIRFDKQSFYAAKIGTFDIISAGKVSFSQESFQTSVINYSRFTSTEISIDQSVFSYMNSDGMEFSGSKFKAEDRAFMGSTIKYLSITCESYNVDKNAFDGANIEKFVRPEWDDNKEINIDTNESVVLDRSEVNGALVKTINITCKSLDIKRDTFSDSLLTSIILNAKEYIKIDDNAFSSTSSLGKVTIIAGTTVELKTSAFRSSSITSLTIESNLIDIGTHCFSGTLRLEDVTIASTELTIGELSFSESGLTTISAIGSDAVTILQDAFSYTACSLLSVSSIGKLHICERALRNCKATNVSASAPYVIMSSESLAHGSFGAVEVRGGDIAIDAKALMNITGGSLLLHAGHELSLGAAALSDARVSVAVVSCGSLIMGGFTFQRSDLSVVHITCRGGFIVPQSAFYRLPNLISVTLEAGGELVVSQGAIRDCDALRSVFASAGGDLLVAGEALYNLGSLQLVNLSANHSMRISRGGFRGCRIGLGVFSAQSVLFEQQCFFLDSTLSEMLVNSDRSVVFQANAFVEKVSLKNVSIFTSGDAVVGRRAFAGRKRLEQFAMNAPKGSLRIEDEAFRDCAGLSGIAAEAGANISVGKSAFVGAAALEAVALVAGTHVEVGEAAFAGCQAIGSLRLEPVEGADIADDSFLGVPNADFGKEPKSTSRVVVVAGSASAGGVVLLAGIIVGVVMYKRRRSRDITDSGIDL